MPAPHSTRSCDALKLSVVPLKSHEVVADATVTLPTVTLYSSNCEPCPDSCMDMSVNFPSSVHSHSTACIPLQSRYLENAKDLLASRHDSGPPPILDTIVINQGTAASPLEVPLVSQTQSSGYPWFSCSIGFTSRSGLFGSCRSS